MDVLVIGSSIVLGVLCALFLILLVNLLTFPRLKSYAPLEQATEQDAPLLSILVPARNEERCIEACVRSLVAQNYERLEVLVLDDASNDATAAIVQRIIDELPGEQKERLRLLSGAPLPAGWVGKNFACHQLAQQACGDYLLFTDADTIHAPGMAGAVLTTMREQHVALLTGQPEMFAGSLGEHLIVPLLNFTILTLLPIALIPRRPETSLATGNGQLLCFRRATYEEIGGHAALKGRILEDVLLARAVKAAGQRVIFVDALLLVRCRMYDSFAEVWAGFSKNLFAFYSYNLPFALVALLLSLTLFVLPPFMLLAALLLSLPPLVVSCALSAYLLAVLMRVLLSLRFTLRQKGVALLLCLLHPLSILLECLILLNSIRWHYRKAGTLWKGRHYT
ncbi:MAG: glycosyltransferase [Chloroflexota bacterium]|nr:glycosyltransferase [Chloroflexota bacterium]